MLPCEKELWALAEKVGQEWWALSAHTSEIYLYILPGGMDAKASSDPPGLGWELAAPSRISRAMTRDQVRLWAFSTLVKVPILKLDR